MLSTISRYAQTGFCLLEKGLAHPSFLGRAVSWGIFYGALYLLVRKIVQVVSNLFQKTNKQTLHKPNTPLRVSVSDRAKTPLKEVGEGEPHTPIAEQALQKEESQPGFEQISPPSPQGEDGSQKKIRSWIWPFR